MRRLAIALACALSGCAGAEGPSLASLQAARTVPADYKAELLAYLRNFLNDPTNVRGAYVSEPVLGRFQGEERYFSCVRFDAKTSYGRYRGSRDHLAVYFGGKLEYFVELRPDAGDDRCRTVDYGPFPELERLARR